MVCFHLKMVHRVNGGLRSYFPYNDHSPMQNLKGAPGNYGLHSISIFLQMMVKNATSVLNLSFYTTNEEILQAQQNYHQSKYSLP